MIDRYFSTEYKAMNFFVAFKEALKSKSFIVFFIFSATSGLQIVIVVTNMLYLTTFVLQVGSDIYMVILGCYLLGTLVSLPIWLRIMRKINDNKKVFVIAGLVQCAALIPLTFFYSVYDLIIWALILGLASGGNNAFAMTIIFPSVVDDFVVQIGKNQKGVLFGISAFLGRLFSTLDKLIFGIVFTVTGFVAGYDTYSELAAVVPDMNLVIIGIRLLAGIIPGAILLIGMLVFWKFFPLTQDVVLKNKASLEKLGF